MKKIFKYLVLLLCIDFCINSFLICIGCPLKVGLGYFLYGYPIMVLISVIGLILIKVINWCLKD